MKYDFKTVIDRENSPYSYSAKWDQNMMKMFMNVDHMPENRICLHTADMDFKAAPAIIDALVKTAEHGIYGYSLVPQAYKDAVCHWYKTYQGWEFDPEHIIIRNGTHTAIVDCILKFTKPGEGVIVLTPSYNYHGDIEGKGRKFVGVKMLEEDGYYTIDFKALEEACKDEHTTMFIIIHPHNPTGRVYTPEELKEMARICRENNVLMLSDEVHSDILRKDVHFEPMMKVVGPEGLIVTTAVNKTFNLAGLAMTNMVIEDPKLLETWGPIFNMVSPFGISAVIAAYNEGREWVEELNEVIDDILVSVKEYMDENLPKAKYRIPEGSYIIWVDFSAYGLSDEELNRRIFEDARVIDQSGTGFDAPELGAQVRRFCLASPKSVIMEAFQRLADAINA